MMRITYTTDDQFLGHVFDETINPIVLREGIRIYVERVIILPDNGKRFVSSSYIIDAKEI